jgi:short-subunit dehydrogenase
MRRPDADALPHAQNLRILPLDVTSQESIAAMVAAAGPIDALVNNAGIGVVGAFEATPLQHIRKVFGTNTFGVMAMCQALIPQMRERRSGVIVNVTSSVTLAAMPLAAAYTASKQAIAGFTGSLAHELGHFDVRVKLVEPGYAPTTRFAENTDVRVEDLIPPAYAGFAAPIFQAFAKPALTTKETDVAEAVWAAIHDTSGQLHFPAGADAVALHEARHG